MTPVLQFAAAALATIFTMVDPFGLVPMYLAAVAGAAPEVRRRAPRRAALIAGVVGLLVAFAGREALHLLGITLSAFSIAGGVLLFVVAMEMVFGRATGAREGAEPHSAGLRAPDPSVFPLAFPMIAGPGTIVTVTLLVDLSKGDPLRVGIVVAALAVAIAASYLTMCFAEQLMRLAGPTGMQVLTRLLGVLLAALAVQFVLNGITGYLHPSEIPIP